MRKFLKFLFFPGIVLAVAGLVVKLVSGTWSPTVVGLLIAGSAIILVWLGWWLSSSGSFWRKRSTQAGTNALVGTISVLVILGLINFMAVRYKVRADLTENQLFTLSPQSQELVENLQQPMKVWVFEGDSNPKNRDLLENYRRYNDQFEFQVVDPQIEVGLAEKFKVKSKGDIYLEYGDKRQLVQTLSPLESLSEVRLTNAIEKIQRDRVQKVYFLQGHGENPLEAKEGGMSEAVTSLNNKGYEVEPLNLAELPAIPDDTAAIVIAGPKRKLFEGEVKALQDYLNSGGSLLLMLDPQTDPGLEPLLKEWGVQLDNRIVIDASGTGNVVGLGPASPLINNYGNHPITEDFSNGISVYPLARTIGTVEVKGVEAVSLLVTNEQTWSESNLESEELVFDAAEDVQGPFDLGVALSRIQSQTESQKKAENQDQKVTEDQTEVPLPPQAVDVEKEQKPKQPDDTQESSPDSDSEASQKNPEEGKEATTNDTDSETSAEKPQDEETKEIESRLVIFGNSTFASNGWFQQQLNGDVFLNSVSWLASDEDESLSIRPKEPENRRINLTPVQAGIIAWMALLIMPLLGLVAAGIAWWRRR